MSDLKSSGIGKGLAGPGRPKGLQNKLTKSAKEAFQHAFDEAGGADGLAQWAKGHRADFYKLYARLIPVDANITGAIDAAMTVKFIEPLSRDISSYGGTSD
jgi:hypothetical protein